MADVSPFTSMNLKSFYLFALSIAFASTILPATAAVTLSEGDPAPELTVSKWLQGEPLKAFQPGTAYLVEFWASWWMPSLEPLAHVNKIHQKFKDKGLVVIGQNVKDKDVLTVEPYINRLSGIMTFRVALDEGATNRLAGKMQQNWLHAAEAGVPTAFIIDKKGIIVFIGHPDEVSDEMIEQVLDGTFDAKKRAVARKADVTKSESWETHTDLGKAAFKAKQWDKALSEVGEIEKIYPHKRVTTGCLRLMVLMGADKFDEAGKLAIQLSDENNDDPFVQYRIARTIANRGATNAAILKKASQFMDRANAPLKGPLPAFLHTQAKIAFLQGKKDRAIQLETDALGLADSLTKDDFAQALDNFKKGKLPQ
jgi:hypothetical protein